MTRTRRTWPRPPVLALFLSVAACSAGAPSPPREEGAPDGPGIAGMLVGEDEAALPYRSVMACTPKVCYYTDTDPTGRFRFLLDSEGEFLIKTAEDLESRPRRSSPMVSVTVAGGGIVDLGHVYAPALPADVPVGADGAVEAGDGLTLLFDPDAEDTPAAVAARRIPDLMVPGYPGLPADGVLAVYALHPFAWKTDVPIGVRVEIDGGSAVSFRTIDEVDGRLSDPVAGGKIGNTVVTEPGSGITLLTHLVVLRGD